MLFFNRTLDSFCVFLRLVPERVDLVFDRFVGDVFPFFTADLGFLADAFFLAFLVARAVVPFDAFDLLVTFFLVDFLAGTCFFFAAFFFFIVGGLCVDFEVRVFVAAGCF